MKNYLAKFIVALLAIFSVATAPACAAGKTPASYDQMWEKVRSAFNNDLPKTALQNVIDIRNRAAADGNQPQLLRALCTEFTLAHEISPDSNAVVTKRIEDALAAEKRPVEHALWENALGQIKGDKTLLLASLANAQALAAARADDYVPAFALGNDSYVFNDDLLHVLGAVVLDHYSYGPNGIDNVQKRDVYARMRKIYEEQRNDLAVLVLDFNYRLYGADHETDTDRMIARIRDAQAKYAKSDKRHKAGIIRHMQLWADGLEAPQISANWDWTKRLNYPGTERRLVIDSKNVSKMEIRFYRVDDLTSRDEAFNQSLSAYSPKKGAKHLIFSLERELEHTPAHREYRDTLKFRLPEAGIYIVEMWADGKVRDSEWLAISRLMAVTTNHTSAQGSESRLAIVDAHTGKPITEDIHLYYQLNGRYPGARIKGKTVDESATFGRWTELKPGLDGYFDVKDYDYRYNLAISAGSDNFFPPFRGDGVRGNYFSTNDVVDNYGRIFTDRAIYRPGQTVKVSGLVYSRVNDDYKAVKGWKGTVVLQNTDRKDIAEFDAETDEFGQFIGEFTLPSPTIPGRFSIVLRGDGVRATEYISVEEYKRPTFRVKLDAASPRELYGKDNYERGDTLVLNGRVETFSGVAIADAKVQWKMKHEYWSWLRNGSDDNSFNEQGEIVSDADGRFVLKFHLKDEGFYRTSCEALASNGESASQTHSLYVGYPTAPKNEAAEQERIELFKVNNNHKGDEAQLVIDLRALPEGAERPVYLFYDVVSSLGGLIDSQRYTIDVTQTKYELKWRKEYGDGARAYVAFLKDGVLYHAQMSVEKPRPDKKLRLSWSTFRDKLQPGQDETWTLTVRRPDGTPADAQVMARLYDASLDAFRTNPWRFDLSFDRRMPSIYASSESDSNYSMRWNQKVADPQPLSFTKWEPTMFDYFANMDRRFATRSKSSVYAFADEAAPMKLYAREGSAPMMMNSAPMAEERPEVHREAPMTKESADEAVNTDDAAEAMQMQVRENFDETAFLLPALRTDADGNVTINFTLPESLTQWNFTALAHERDMNYGLLNDTIVAQKKLMTEIAAPRFLRAGDKTEIPVTVRNLTETELKGELIFLVTDAATGKPLKTEKRTFSLASTADQNATSSQTTLFFPLSTTCDVNVRAVAKAADFSDGEERNIPFFDGRETVQVSIPFSSTTKGNIHLDLAPLKLAQLMKKDAACQPVLSVEYCANPIWNVVRVVPALLEGQAYSANDWATRLYTIEVADFLSRKLKGTESAALVDSLLAAKDIPALRYAARDHLADFQLGNGGFSWFKGFYASPWITADVCVLLARQQKMTGSTTASAMLSSAVNYLSGVADEWVKDMKKQKASSVPEVMMRYLYVRQLLGLEPGKNDQYLLDIAAKEKKELTMYGKSVLAQIAMDSHQADAILALESLIEHTVATPEMGRYFDTERAFGGWASYKIPTQTMAIEALGHASTVGVNSIEGLTGKTGDAANVGATLDLQSEMKLWLLQSKRTQKWESSRASADATYALLHGDCYQGAGSKLFQTLTPENYSKHALSASEASRAIKSGSYNINKDTEGLSWGALYADYTLPAEMVEASSAGFTLSRKWEVLRDGKWMEIPASANGAKPAFTVKVGEHVRQTITLRAERDYDFVQVECSRAACLEPLAPLSGFCWLGNTSAYRMVHDSSNEYFFEHLAKGTHTFSEELIVDRSGNFTTGIARVQCTFAPEFRAYAPSFTLSASH